MYETNGVEIVYVNETGPAYLAGLRDGTIITMIDGAKIEDTYDFIGTFEYCVHPGKEVVLSNATHDFAIIPSQNPDSPEKPFVGINLQTNTVVKEDSKKHIGLFNWFKDLFKWLFLLNFFIGLANLLPIFITDGAQMLRLMLSRVIKNQKRSLTTWKLINGLFLLLLVIGLLGTYVKLIL
jgi:membrane-associated protease RseP (regulator of RpoE activity)